jgi:hypothetical protein
MGRFTRRRIAKKAPRRGAKGKFVKAPKKVRRHSRTVSV